MEFSSLKHTRIHSSASNTHERRRWPETFTRHSEGGGTSLIEKETMNRRTRSKGATRLDLSNNECRILRAAQVSKECIPSIACAKKEQTGPPVFARAVERLRLGEPHLDNLVSRQVAPFQAVTRLERRLPYPDTRSFFSDQPGRLARQRRRLQVTGEIKISDR